MSFGFIGGGSVGAGGSVVTIKNTNFSNWNPDATKFHEVWEKDNFLKPEPDICHVFVVTRLPYMDRYNATGNVAKAGSCGAAFGYVFFEKGSVPEKLYGWKGRDGDYPYTYSQDSYFCGLNSAPNRTNAFELPVPCPQSKFGANEPFIPPDAKNHFKGDWVVVFNGGKGGPDTNPGGFVSAGAAGSSGSIFGDGYDGTSQYGAGSGGNASASGKGAAAVGMHPKVMPQWADVFKATIIGDDPISGKVGASGKATFNVPADYFIFGSAPSLIDVSRVALPEPQLPQPGNVSNNTSMTFTVINQYF